MKQPPSSSNPLKKLFWNAARAVTVALDVAILPATIIARDFTIALEKIKASPDMTLGAAAGNVMKTLRNLTLVEGVIPGVVGAVLGGFTQSTTVGFTTAYLTAEAISLVAVLAEDKIPAKDYIQFMPLTRRLDNYVASLSAPNP